MAERRSLLRRTALLLAALALLLGLAAAGEADGAALTLDGEAGTALLLDADGAEHAFTLAAAGTDREWYLGADGAELLRVLPEDGSWTLFPRTAEAGGRAVYQAEAEAVLAEDGAFRAYGLPVTAGDVTLLEESGRESLLVLTRSRSRVTPALFTPAEAGEGWQAWAAEDGKSLLIENTSDGLLPPDTWSAAVSAEHESLRILSRADAEAPLAEYPREISADGWALYVNENVSALAVTAGEIGPARYDAVSGNRQWRVFRSADGEVLLENLSAGNLAKNLGWRTLCFGAESAGAPRVLMVNRQTGARYVYERMAEDGPWAMYACPELLSVTVCNPDEGLILCSTLPAGDIPASPRQIHGATYSGAVILARNGTSISSSEQVDLLRSEPAVTWEPAEKGFLAHVSIPRYGFAFDLRVALDGDSVTATVPDESIREENPTYTITWLNLFPMMGATNQDDKPEGYLFVPDGTGGLIWMNDKHGRFATGYQGPVYGRDDGFWASGARTYLHDTVDTLNETYTALIPVFGLAQTNAGQGFVAIIESGDTRCRVVASPNGVTNLSYNRIYAGFHLREAYRQKTTNIEMLEADRYHADLSVRYCMLTGDEANYAGMAVRYREYLLENGGIAQRDTAYRTRVDFLGSERENFLVGTKAVVMTSADDVRAIIDDLRGAGVSTLFSAYRGWQSGGLYALPVDSFSADGAIGGNDAVRRLIGDEAEQGALICLYADALRMNAATNTFTHDVAKMHSQADIAETNLKPVYRTFYFMVPGSSAERLRSLSRSLRGEGIASLAVAGITGKLFSWSARNAYFSREDCARAFRGVLDELAADTSLAMEAPNAFCWPAMSAFLDLPLHTSGYQYIDQEIPFLAIVLKGVVPIYSEYVNFEANKQAFFLQMVETGVCPSFYITRENASALIYTNSNDLYSVQYGSYRDTIVDYDRQLRALAEKTAGAVITGHAIDGDLRCVTYSNGTEVWVNYGRTAAETPDGLTVGPMDYAVREGGSEP